MRSCRRAWVAAFLAVVVAAIPVRGGLQTIETDNLRLIYFGKLHAYIVPHVARCLENSLKTHREVFGYEPTGRITVLLHDFNDYANASGGAIPVNHVMLGLAPFAHDFETMSVNESMNAIMNHELVHVVASDQAAGGDRTSRSLFFGKVRPVDDNPLSLLYGYMTSPREYAPRWYHEGIATFMETWLAGGLGRAMGAYDEMAFRAMVLDNKPIFDLVALEAAGTKIDFLVGVNSYLYGTRFMSYLALTYGPEKVIAWVKRTDGSAAYFAGQFRQVFGRSVHEAWADWIRWEKEFQAKNLAAIRANPVTVDQPLSPTPLGSVSRPGYDPATGTLYAAVNYPGQIAHLAAIDTARGTLRKILDVKGPAMFFVASLAFDPAAGMLFYTTDNNEWRDIRVVDVRTGEDRTLLKDARVGDLAFNPADRSLWGVRHYNGIATLVRIPHPWTEWNQVYTFPYGKDIYNLAVSPDGASVCAALGEITGRQTLIRLDTAALLAGGKDYETLFDFENSVPADFVFTPDGRHLVGSSYYTGASNLFRYELATKEMAILTNCETGYFRPVPLADGRLLAMRYTSQGFLPVEIERPGPAQAAAIRFLGQEVVETHPIVKTWKAGSPADIDLPALTRYEGPFKGLSNIRLASAYPVVEGYKDTAAVGARLHFLGPMALHNLDVTLSYSPDTALPSDERFHVNAHYAYMNWKVTAKYNAGDFYDLFGPTKTSRKGYSGAVEYRRNLIYDEPRTMDYTLEVAAYGGLDRLPDYQNVVAPYDKMLEFGASWNYTNCRSSLGSVNYEKGYDWDIAAGCSVVNGTAYPRALTNFDVGVPFGPAHSSLWLRTSAGYCYGGRTDPFANFFFGGFGNNWVDHQEVQRYREYYSFPGAELNEIGGKTYAKGMVEWCLPPLRFQHLGTTQCFATWVRPGLFVAALATDFDNADFRREVYDVGAQMDFRIIVLSTMNLTFSLGYAMAFEDGHKPVDEIMISLKIF